MLRRGPGSRVCVLVTVLLWPGAARPLLAGAQGSLPASLGSLVATSKPFSRPQVYSSPRSTERGSFPALPAVLLFLQSRLWGMLGLSPKVMGAGRPGNKPGQGAASPGWNGRTQRR